MQTHWTASWPSAPDFPFEIYVSEDCGSDGTRAILEGYAARYPERIRLRLRSRNVGISRNWYEGLSAARGQYVCTLEGDDWWLDDHKLQKAGGLSARQSAVRGGQPHPSPHRRRGQHLRHPAGRPAHPGQERLAAAFSAGHHLLLHRLLAKNIFRIPDPKREAYVTANRSIADFARACCIWTPGRCSCCPRPWRPTGWQARIPATKTTTAAKAARKNTPIFSTRSWPAALTGRAKYHFGRCLLAGSFYPFIDRVKYGGLGPFFFHQMRRLPLGVKLAFRSILRAGAWGLVMEQAGKGAKHG